VSGRGPPACENIAPALDDCSPDAARCVLNPCTPDRSTRRATPTWQASLRIDRTAPVTSIGTDAGSSDGANGWYRSAVTVSASAADDEAVVESRCVLEPVAVPVSFADLPAGPCESLLVAGEGGCDAGYFGSPMIARVRTSTSQTSLSPKQIGAPCRAWSRLLVSSRHA
jgi:hypothetical protein